MQGYVPGEQPQANTHLSRPIIKLNTNENPYPPSSKVFEAIQSAARSRMERYPDPLGTTFRNAAAQVLNVSPDSILCGNGSDDILTIVTRAFVGNGDRLRLPYPSYILYRTLAQLQGAEWEEVPFQKDFTLPVSFGSSADRLKLVFLPNPNSPSGTMVSKKRILELADSLPCPLLVDEAYADFADENCIDLIDQNPKIMVSRTLSKSYALAGLRFGFLVAHPTMIAMLRKVKDSYNCDAISIAAATAAMQDQSWLLENRSKILKTRQGMEQRANQLGFTTTESQANFVWCTRTDREVKSLYEQLKQQNVLVRYMNYPNWGEGLRISVGTDAESETAMNLLQAIL